MCWLIFVTDQKIAYFWRCKIINIVCFTLRKVKGLLFKNYNLSFNCVWFCKINQKLFCSIILSRFSLKLACTLFLIKKPLFYVKTNTTRTLIALSLRIFLIHTLHCGISISSGIFFTCTTRRWRHCQTLRWICGRVLISFGGGRRRRRNARFV